MNREEIYEHLCWHDPRNPHNVAPDDEDDRIEPRRDDCRCDNCFYSRDKLAVELLKHIEQ
jgi:hypothetical protein